jgi:hypothetical protein
MPDHSEHPISSTNESRDHDLNRHRDDDQQRARAEVTERLNDRGIEVRASDSSEDVVDLYEAIEAFESAVEAHGGDLMVDSPPSREPDDPRFMLPQRDASESLTALTTRVRSAADALRSARAD